MHDRHEFTWLTTATRQDLLATLAVTQQDLANLHADIAFARVNETKDNPAVREARITMEGERDALTEKKWLIVRLLDECHDDR